MLFNIVFPNYPVLILFAPLAAGLIVGVLGRSVGPKVAGIGVVAELMAFVFSLVLLFEVTTRGPQTIDLPRWSDGILQFGMYIDRLTAVMMVHIAAISTLIHLFSIRYMQQERGYGRFYSLSVIHHLCPFRHGVERQPADAFYLLAVAELAGTASVS